MSLFLSFLDQRICLRQHETHKFDFVDIDPFSSVYVNQDEENEESISVKVRSLQTVKISSCIHRNLFLPHHINLFGKGGRTSQGEGDGL